MNTLFRILRSLRATNGADASFETYYGQLVRRNPSYAPSAAEARRDFNAVRPLIERMPPF